LWAFSEAALGGILHALKIPFTGLFIGGSAVIFITLLAYYSDSSKVIIEVTLKVALVKFIVSPYSPIFAYLAILIQCFLGYVLFYRGFNKFSPIILGFLSLLFSAFQKLIILTLLFGMTLWESIDVFFDFILNRVFPNNLLLDEFNISFIIVGLYISSHIVGGLVAGWYGSILPLRLENRGRKKVLYKNFDENKDLNIYGKKEKRKNWWFKPSSIAIFMFSVLLILLSFVFEDFNQNLASRIAIMLLRSVLILGVWYYFISPILLKLINSYLTKKSEEKASEIKSIIQLFPNIKSLIKVSWLETKSNKRFRRIILFIDNILINFLINENSEYEKYDQNINR